MVTEEEISIRQLTTEKMKPESLKQREQRISYQRSIGIRESAIRVEGMMHDRFANEEFCEECGNNPCTCEEDKLRDIRGGM